MMLREVLSGGPHLSEEVLPEFLAVFARIRKLIADGVRDGSFRSVDPLLTHLSIVGSLVFFFATHLSASASRPREDPVAARRPRRTSGTLVS